ncbi:hypothetical protein LguiA_031400 [Lonicera macranthoides]
MDKDREKKHKPHKKVVEAEFKISMHCNACERTVAKAISKIKGVETFTTDMGADRVKIKGQIDPDKVLKKLKKKTGKRVEILVNNNNNDKHGEKDEDPNEKDGDDLGLGGVSSERVIIADSFAFESIVLTMFSDENANACLLM